MPDVLMPDGTKIRNVPANATRAQIVEAYQRARQAGEVKDTRPTSFLQGLREGVSGVVANVSDALTQPALLPLTAPLMALGLSRGSDGKPRIAPPGVVLRDKSAQGSRASNTRGSTAGRITGEVLATLPVGAMRGGLALQGAMSGYLATKNPRDTRGAAYDTVVGGVGGKVGGEIGKRVIAPVLERAGRTAPARAVASAATKAINAAGGQVKTLPLPKFTKPERVVQRAAPGLDEVQRNLKDAARLNLPYALADSSPELRALAGSVSRKSPDAAARAERVLAPRARGRADRAVSAIDSHLAPITNIEQRSAAIKEGARRAAQRYYDEALSAPIPQSAELDAILKTPAGQEAFRRAQQIMANDGADAGTFRTLDYTKRGLDSVLNDSRNPISGRLNLEGDPMAASTNNVLQRFKGVLDELSPEYADARRVYQENIAPRTALQQGYDVLPKGNVPQRQFDEAVSNLTPETLPEAQRGYATAMADQVDRVRLSGDPYNAIYGSPLQQGKVDALFPEGAVDFGRIYDLESQMSKTAYETLGGSPTQRRAMADQLFDSKVADMSGAALDMATGSPLSAALRAGRQYVQDTARTRGEESASALAPTLFDTNPEVAAEFIGSLIRKEMEERARRAAYQRAGGLLALPTAAGAVGGVQP